MTDSPALELADVGVVIAGRRILRGVNLSVARGRFLGIVGPNGGGKTTLLKVILGFIAPDEGTVCLLGSPPRETTRGGRLVGYLPQASHLDPNFPASALDVVLMGRYGRLGLLRGPGKQDHEAARRALARVGLEEVASRHFGQLSGGQQQRVSIARAIAGEPEILILDEPSTSIDRVAQEDLHVLLKDLQERLGLTIIMVSHDIGVVSTLVDEVACLNVTLSYHGCAEGFERLPHLEATYGKQIGVLRHGAHCHESPGASHD